MSCIIHCDSEWTPTELKNPDVYSAKAYNSVIEAEGRTLVTPPVLIAGKACMMQCEFCTYSVPVLSTTDINIQARQNVEFFVNLTDQRGQFYEYTDGAYKKTPAVGQLLNNLFYSCGSQLVQIPNGPFQLRVRVRRTDNGMLASNLDSGPTRPNPNPPSIGWITCILRFTLVE